MKIEEKENKTAGEKNIQYLRNKIYKAFEGFSVAKSRQGYNFKYYSHDDLLIEVRKRLAEKVPEAYMYVCLDETNIIYLSVEVEGKKPILQSAFDLDTYRKMHESDRYKINKISMSPEQHMHSMTSFAIKNLIRTLFMLPTGEDEEGKAIKDVDYSKTPTNTVKLTKYQQLDKAIRAIPKGVEEYSERLGVASIAISTALNKKEISDDECKQLTELIEELKRQADAIEAANPIPLQTKTKTNDTTKK